MGSLSPNAKQQFFTNAGLPASNCKLYTYATGSSTTPVATYTDKALTALNPNPITLDARGEAIMYLLPQAYRYVLKDSLGATIWTRDGVSPPADSADLVGTGANQGASLVGFLQAGTGATPRTSQNKMRDVVSVLDFGALGNGIEVVGAVSIASGTNALTVVGAAFTAGDVGKLIMVLGAGVSSAVLYATISGWMSGTQVALSANASTTVTAVTQAVRYATDDAAAFQLAINALPTEGGTVLVPDAIYGVGTAPSAGTRSIRWDIGSGAKFVDAALFPSATTNPFVTSRGRLVKSQASSATGTFSQAADSIEMLQPAGYNGNSVALYLGASGSSPTGNVWAMNPLIQANAGAGGTYQCLEVDCNKLSSTALVKGIGISGVGSFNPDVALEITHQQQWNTGISILRAVTGMLITSNVTNGISVGGPTTGVGAVFLARQLLNGNETISLQRKTDIAPTGNFLHFLTSSGTDLFVMDVSGNSTQTGTCQASQIRVFGATPATTAGQLGFGGLSATTVGAAGGATALPATPLTYIICSLNGSTVKIPVYNP